MFVNSTTKNLRKTGVISVAQILIIKNLNKLILKLIPSLDGTTLIKEIKNRNKLTNVKDINTPI